MDYIYPFLGMFAAFLGFSAGMLVVDNRGYTPEQWQSWACMIGGGAGFVLITAIAVGVLT